MYFSFIEYIGNKGVKVKPEVIWLIVRMMYHHGDKCKLLPLNRSEMMADHSISTTVYADMIRFFQQLDLLEVDDGQRYLRLSTFLKDFDLPLLNAKANVERGGIKIHRDLLAKIMGRNVKDAGYIAKTEVDKTTEETLRSSTRLRISNLLLLVILINYSDLCGCVRGVSRGRLRKMMGGISDDRLKSLLNTLLSEGYLLNYVGGGTHPYLFGKAKSAFYLNLIKLRNPAGQLQTNESVNELPRNVNLLASSSISATQSLLLLAHVQSDKCLFIKPSLHRSWNRWSKWGCGEFYHFSIGGFLNYKWLENIEKNNLEKLLQVSLERVASSILSESWDVIPVFDENYTEVIPDGIKSQLAPMFERDGQKELFFTEKAVNLKSDIELEANEESLGISEISSYDQFIHTLTNYAWRLAISTKSLLGQINAVAYAGMQHTLVYPHAFETIKGKSDCRVTDIKWNIQSVSDSEIILTTVHVKYLHVDLGQVVGSVIINRIEA